VWGGTSGALPRARWLWDAERVLYLPSETDLQRLILPHPLLVQACNYYYDILHFPLLGACLIWLYTRHRTDYPRIRTTVALFTGISLLIQLITVAPPRLLASTGMVDTAVQYGQSVYAWSGGFDADEFSAMPSVHVGWAVIVAVAEFASRTQDRIEVEVHARRGRLWVRISAQIYNDRDDISRLTAALAARG
jgi:hypothetical protein